MSTAGRVFWQTLGELLTAEVRMLYECKMCGNLVSDTDLPDDVRKSAMKKCLNRGCTGILKKKPKIDSSLESKKVDQFPLIQKQLEVRPLFEGSVLCPVDLDVTHRTRHAAKHILILGRECGGLGDISFSFKLADHLQSKLKNIEVSLVTVTGDENVEALVAPVRKYYKHVSWYPKIDDHIKKRGTPALVIETPVELLKSKTELNDPIRPEAMARISETAKLAEELKSDETITWEIGEYGNDHKGQKGKLTSVMGLGQTSVGVVTVRQDYIHKSKVTDSARRFLALEMLNKSRELLGEMILTSLTHSGNAVLYQAYIKEIYMGLNFILTVAAKEGCGYRQRIDIWLPPGEHSYIDELEEHFAFLAKCGIYSVMEVLSVNENGKKTHKKIYKKTDESSSNKGKKFLTLIRIPLRRPGKINVPRRVLNM